jgi:hypothetical protein
MLGEPDEPGKGSQADGPLEDAVRRIFEDLSTEEFGQPADMIAVWRDDELLDALGAGDLGGESAPPRIDHPADPELLELLAAWRRDSAAEPSPLESLVPPCAVPPPSCRPARPRGIPVTSAALVVLTVVIGLALTVPHAAPGDLAPWGISRELDSHRAESIEVAQRTRDHLDEASAALTAGHAAAAAAALDEAGREVRQVRPQDGRRALQNRHRELKNELRRTKASPSRHVPPPAASTTDSPQPGVIPATDRETGSPRGGPSPDATPAREHKAVDRPTGQATSTPDRHGTMPSLDEASTSSIPTAQDHSQSLSEPSRTDAPSTLGRRDTPTGDEATDRPRADRPGSRHPDDRTADDQPAPQREETTHRRSEPRGDIERPHGDDVPHGRSGHHERGHQHRGTDR